MAFVVLEGFSGTGKTTLAKKLESQGWLRLQESAHALPNHVPVASRGDTFSDYSLLGATLAYASTISRFRGKRNLVSEGYLISDLAYAKIRFELKKSFAYPSMLLLCKEVLSLPRLKPDLYVLLGARPGTIFGRQLGKADRDKNPSHRFMSRYYSALADVHRELGETRVERLKTDSDEQATLEGILAMLRRKGVVGR